jgi:hypothetical protein
MNVDDLIFALMKEENIIRDKLGVYSAWCSAPEIRTITTEWERFKELCFDVFRKLKIDRLDADTAEFVYASLEDANYHSLNKAFMEYLNLE